MSKNTESDCFPGSAQEATSVSCVPEFSQDTPRFTEVAPGIHVLVVDDQDAVRELTRETVGVIFPNAKIHEGADGLHAAQTVDEMARVFRDRYTVVISDQMMPILTGMDLYARIRQTPGMEQTPFVLTSGYMPDDHKQAVEGASGTDPRFKFVRKPFVPGELIHAIEQVTGIKF
jgi:CheY-like chemotaxis protein